jgi:F-type H+-transporting ATPase subunit a
MFREGRIVLVVAIFILFLFQPVCNTRASEPQGPQAGEIHQKTNIKNKGARHEKFETGHFMFNHIGDDHEWHIIDIKNTIVSIPLPVILYSKQKGIVLFLSSKFQHGRSEYNGFRLETHGDNKGKII